MITSSVATYIFDGGGGGVLWQCLILLQRKRLFGFEKDI